MTTMMTPEYVDEVIKRHWVSLSNFYSIKNSFLPIFRLPPEILARVFICCARDYYYEERNYPTDRIPRWVNVSYVCRRWRDIAINCQALWAYQFFLSPRWTRELLARSRNASLKTRIHVNSERVGHWHKENVEKLLGHMERIKELRLHVPDELLPTNFALSAPRLRILDVKSLTYPSQWTTTISDGNTPSLRILRLGCCTLPLECLDLSGLTTLFLRLIPPSSQLDIARFLAVLGPIQGLKVLHLQDALPSARQFFSSGAFDASPKIGLPRLESLFVAAPLSTTVTLLSCINVPLKTEIGLEIQSEDATTVDDYLQIASILAQRYRQSKDAPSSCLTFRSLVLRFPKWDSSFTLYASEDVDCDPELPTVDSPLDCNIPLGILVRWNETRMSDEDGDRIAHDICCSIPFPHVQTLQVVHSPLSLDFWRGTLRHLHGLRRMTLSWGPMPDLTSLFSAMEPEETPRGTGRRDARLRHEFVPALEELTLHRIRFATERAVTTDSIRRDALFKALSTRQMLPSHLTLLRCLEGNSSWMDGYDSEEI